MNSGTGKREKISIEHLCSEKLCIEDVELDTIGGTLEDSKTSIPSASAVFEEFSTIEKETACLGAVSSAQMAEHRHSQLAHHVLNQQVDTHIQQPSHPEWRARFEQHQTDASAHGTFSAITKENRVQFENHLNDPNAHATIQTQINKLTELADNALLIASGFTNTTLGGDTRLLDSYIVFDDSWAYKHYTGVKNAARCVWNHKGYMVDLIPSENVLVVLTHNQERYNTLTYSYAEFPMPDNKTCESAWADAEFVYFIAVNSADTRYVYKLDTATWVCTVQPDIINPPESGCLFHLGNNTVVSSFGHGFKRADTTSNWEYFACEFTGAISSHSRLRVLGTVWCPDKNYGIAAVWLHYSEPSSLLSDRYVKFVKLNSEGIVQCVFTGKMLPDGYQVVDNMTDHTQPITLFRSQNTLYCLIGKGCVLWDSDLTNGYTKVATTKLCSLSIDTIEDGVITRAVEHTWSEIQDDYVYPRVGYHTGFTYLFNNLHVTSTSEDAAPTFTSDRLSRVVRISPATGDCRGFVSDDPAIVLDPGNTPAEEVFDTPDNHVSVSRTLSGFLFDNKIFRNSSDILAAGVFDLYARYTEKHETDDRLFSYVHSADDAFIKKVSNDGSWEYQLWTGTEWKPVVINQYRGIQQYLFGDKVVIQIMVNPEAWSSLGLTGSVYHIFDCNNMMFEIATVGDNIERRIRVTRANTVTLTAPQVHELQRMKTTAGEVRFVGRKEAPAGYSKACIMLPHTNGYVPGDELSEFNPLDEVETASWYPHTDRASYQIARRGSKMIIFGINADEKVQQFDLNRPSEYSVNMVPPLTAAENGGSTVGYWVTEIHGDWYLFTGNKTVYKAFKLNDMMFTESNAATLKAATKEQLYTEMPESFINELDWGMQVDSNTKEPIHTPCIKVCSQAISPTGPSLGFGLLFDSVYSTASDMQFYYDVVMLGTRERYTFPRTLLCINQLPTKPASAE